MQTITAAGLELIKYFESHRSVAYQDATGRWTIGWGHTQGVYPGQTCKTDEAELFLDNDLQDAEQALDRWCE